jgi:hypothetical protein
MYDFSVFEELFEDEKTSVSPLEDGGAMLTVENGAILLHEAVTASAQIVIR